MGEMLNENISKLTSNQKRIERERKAKKTL